MLTFPTKYPDEIRNASVDLSDDLAPGESFIGIATVQAIVGDVVVSDVVRAGAVVAFTLKGGTTGAVSNQQIKIECSTDGGQVIEAIVRVPIRNS